MSVVLEEFATRHGVHRQLIPQMLELARKRRRLPFGVDLDDSIQLEEREATQADVAQLPQVILPALIVVIESQRRFIWLEKLTHNGERTFAFRIEKESALINASSIVPEDDKEEKGENPEDPRVAAHAVRYSLGSSQEPAYPE